MRKICSTRLFVSDERVFLILFYWNRSVVIQQNDCRPDAGAIVLNGYALCCFPTLSCSLFLSLSWSLPPSSWQGKPIFCFYLTTVRWLWVTNMIFWATGKHFRWPWVFWWAKVLLIRTLKRNWHTVAVQNWQILLATKNCKGNWTSVIL